MTDDAYGLLGRGPIDLDVHGSYLAGRRILVTGAGGSIGSILCHAITRWSPEKLVMLDRDESALHAVQMSLSGRALFVDDSCVLGDIRDGDRMYQVMEQHQPEIIFHAAALKHQPLLERYPGEALKTNVLGTWNLVYAALHSKVEIFVHVSTDKAADPICVLGMSKRIAERIVAWDSTYRYMSVRFGNVFDSRGSASRTFRQQIKAGRPVTVTDPEMRRYFLTGEEAAGFLVHAGAIGQGREVLVMDMGKQVRIVDLARRMIGAYGSSSQIMYTGLRPRERLTELRLGADEPDFRPTHPLITQTPVRPIVPSAVFFHESGHDDDTRHWMDKMYKSDSSVTCPPPQEPAQRSSSQ